MFHDIAYTVAENVGKNSKDAKNRKLEADDKWLDCFKVRTPYDMLAYSAIKSKRKLGLGKIDMIQYSKMNRGYKYIFTNIDVFSKITYAFPLKSKK